MKLCRDYEKSSTEEKQVIRNQRLKKIVEHARKNSPYYNNLYLSVPESFTLMDLPTTNKKTLMANWNGRKLGAHFLYGSMRCVRRGYYEITLLPIEPVEGEEYGYSKQYMRMLEQDIKAQPHMWLWTHKRWKWKRS